MRIIDGVEQGLRVADVELKTHPEKQGIWEQALETVLPKTEDGSVDWSKAGDYFCSLLSENFSTDDQIFNKPLSIGLVSAVVDAALTVKKTDKPSAQMLKAGIKNVVIPNVLANLIGGQNG
jgi:hypothetical protein